METICVKSSDDSDSGSAKCQRDIVILDLLNSHAMIFPLETRFDYLHAFKLDLRDQLHEASRYHGLVEW
jgi:hypothetical protein